MLAATLRGQSGATAGLAVLLRWRCGRRAAPRRPRGGYNIWDVAFGHVTVFAAADTPVTPEARCHKGFWSKPPSP